MTSVDLDTGDTIQDNYRAELCLNQIVFNLSTISQLANELDNINKLSSTPGTDKKRSELIIKSKEQDATRLIEATNKSFVELASQPILDRAIKVQTENLKVDFQRILHKFQRVQASIWRRLHLESQRASAQHNYVNLDSCPDDRAGGAYVSEGAQVQMQNNTQAELQDLGIALEQEEEMRVIEEHMENVKGIFQKLSDLVYEQRAAVDLIEDHIESAYVDQQSGTETLLKTATRRVRSRKRCCICSIVLVVVVVIVVIVLVLELKPKS